MRTPEGGQSSSKKRVSKKNKVTIASTIVALVAAVGLIVGIGNGSVHYTDIDSTRTTIEIEYPPEGMDSTHYEVWYIDSKLGSSFFGAGSPSTGVTVLSGLLDNKDNFNIKFYDGSDVVGIKRLSELDEASSMLSVNAMVLNSGLDFRMQMLELDRFRLYSTNTTDVGDMTLLITDEAMPSDIDSAFANNHFIWIDQMDTSTKINKQFGIIESRFPDGFDTMYLYSNMIQPEMIVDLPSVYELSSQGIGTLFDMIPDNTIRAGNDIYDLNSSYYTANKILDSRQKSGDGKLVIWYKINGYWFDLLDEDYKGSDYFVKANAVPQSEVDKWESTILSKKGELYYNIFDGIAVASEIDIIK